MGSKGGAKKPPADDPFEREMQGRAKKAEGDADLAHEKARSLRLANNERESRPGGADSESAAKVGVHHAQAAVHAARARVFDEQAEAVRSKRVNDSAAYVGNQDRMRRTADNADAKSQAEVAHSHARASLTHEQAKSTAWKRENEHEAHVSAQDRLGRTQSNADAKSQADVAHTHARTAHTQAQATKTQAETAAVRYRTSSAARDEPFKRESEARARTVWGQQDEDRARRNAHFEARAHRENVHSTIAAVRGVLGAFGGGNGELRSGLRGQIRGQ